MDERFAIDNNPKMYHSVMHGLLTAAFKLREKKGYNAMRDTLRDGQLRHIFDLIEGEKGLPAEAIETCIVNTLIDIHNTSAKALDRETLHREHY